MIPPGDALVLRGPGTDRASLAWLLLFGLVLLGAGIGLRDPWPADEPRFALVAKHMAESGQWLFPYRGGELYPDKPPVFMWAIAGFYRLTGSLRIAFLLPSLLSGLGCLALVHDLARRVWDRPTAFRAGLMLLFTLQFTAQAKLAQIDMMVTFFITLGLYGFLRFLLCGDGWRWYYLGWFAAGLGIITKGVGILAPLVLIPALWTHRAGLRTSLWKAWMKALAGPLLMFIGVGLWLLPMLTVVHLSQDPTLAAYRDEILFRQTMTRYADAWHHTAPFWYYLVEVIPGFWLPLSLLIPWFVPRVRDALRAGDKAVVLLTGFLLLVLTFFSISAGKRGVYITPATPALALLASPWLPELLGRRWPPRLFRGLGWLLSLVFLGAAAALLASPGLSASVTDMGPRPWILPLSMGVVAACLSLALRRAPLVALLAVLASLWLHYSLWACPLLDGVRSGRRLMNQVAKSVPLQDRLLIVGMREQHLLQGGRPVEHYAYRMPEVDQAAAAAGWVLRSADRWVLGRKTAMDACFDSTKAVAAGSGHNAEWMLYRADAVVPSLRTSAEPPTPFLYRPEP